jgi:anti-anti-sigma factor
VLSDQSAVVVGRFQGTVVVTLHGDLDANDAWGLSGVLCDLIDGQGNLAVVVDVRDIGAIDDSAVHTLAVAADTIAARGGELRLGGPSGLVFDALTLAGLAGLISIPFEQAHRPWSPRQPNASALRTTAIEAHPARGFRHRGDGEGDVPVCDTY